MKTATKISMIILTALLAGCASPPANQNPPPEDECISAIREPAKEVVADLLKSQAIASDTTLTNP
jgi:PBP1b-binding outer membrane lipoprotein LpoB